MLEITMFCGIFNPFELCHEAPSQINNIMSSLYSSDNFSKNTFITCVLQLGITKKKFSPVNGSTAPYTYLYSLM